MKKYEEVSAEKAIELLTKGKTVFIVVEARAGGFLAEIEEDPRPKYNWALETDEQEEDDDEPEPAPEPAPKRKSPSAFEWVDPEENYIKEAPEKKPKPQRKNSVDTGKIRALFEAGWKMYDIADDVGCSPETVRRTLIQEGLWKPNPRKG